MENSGYELLKIKDRISALTPLHPYALTFAVVKVWDII